MSSILTNLPQLTAATNSDWLYIVDVSDTTDNPAGSSKKILRGDLYAQITGFTYLDNTITLSLSDNSTYVVTINSMTGLTINGDIVITGQTTTGTISATTYYNLPLDVYTTGGTYDNGTIIFTNNSGGTYSVTGLVTGDTYWTSGSTGNFSIKAKNDSGLDATGDYAVAEGFGTIASGYASHAEGIYTQAIGNGSHSEGGYYDGVDYVSGGTAIGHGSHAEGRRTISGWKSFTVDSVTNGLIRINASYGDITAEFVGYKVILDTKIYTYNTVTFSSTTNTEILLDDPSVNSGSYVADIENLNSPYGEIGDNGVNSHAEGSQTKSLGYYSHAEGQATIASGNYGSHAEGVQTIASGNDGSHAEGRLTKSIGTSSHAEGINTTAIGDYSHAEGDNTKSIGTSSHAGGYSSTASGDTSFIHSTDSIVIGDRSVVLGGQGITGETNDMVYVPYFNIQSATTDNILTEVLVIDINGDVKKRSVNTIGFTGGTVSGATIFTGGLSANTFSATTYYNLPLDVFTTGGTYNNTTGIVTFINNSGGTFDVTGFFKPSDDNYTTGYTYNNNTLTLKRNNSLPDLSVTIDTLTGLTINGNLTVTGLTTSNAISANTITATTITATNYENLPFTDNETIEGFISGDTTYVRLKEIVSAPSGGTRTFLGNVIVSSGFTASTISATTYYNLPVTVDTYTTGFTFNVSNYDLTIKQNNGQTDLTVNLGILSSDITITGGTYSPTTGIATFTNNTGGTFSVSGFITGMTDTYVTGFTYSNNTLTIKQNAGQPDLSVNIDTLTGLTINGDLIVTGQTTTDSLSANTITASTITATNYENLPFTDNQTVEIFLSGGTEYLRVKDVISAPSGGTRTFEGNVVVNNGFTANTISATTYYNLPVTSDTYTTGGTYNNTTGIATFTNNSGGTFNVTGFYTGATDTYTTGYTYNNNTFTIKRNNGLSDLSVNVNTMTGLTINGDLTVTGRTTSTSISATTITANTITATNYENLPFTDNQTLELFISGGTEYARLKDNISAPSGGTRTFQGNVVVNGGFTANTISATTYYNLPVTIDTYTTGFTFNSSNYDLTIKRNNSQPDLTVNLGILSSDVTITGGTYNPTTGIATFTNNTGGTFNVSGFYTGSTDNFTTGYTYNDNTFTIKRNNDLPDLSVNVNTMTGLTINGNINVTGQTTTGSISATTYYNLPLDVFTTGGTYSNGTLTFTNNSGGTFNVSGLITGTTDSYTTGFTYSNNTFTLSRNNGLPNLTANINSLTGLTINGDLTVTGRTTTNSLSASTITATTVTADNYENLPFTDNQTVEIFLSGGTEYLRVKDIISAPSGGTRTFQGNVVVNNGFTANTISATTYYNLPTTVDTFTTGFTFNASNYDLTIKRNNSQPDLTVNLGILSSDVTITGGTYNSTTGIATFTNNTGGTFNVTGFLTGMTDTYVSGFTYSNNNLTIKQTAGKPDLLVNINTLTGLTINGDLTVTGLTTSNAISANTITATTITATDYQNLPFTDNQTIEGFVSGNTTYVRIKEVVSAPSGGTRTFQGNVVVSSGFTANTISATTYYNLPTTIDTYTTGGTYNTSTGIATFTNNTGGTFNVTGFTSPTSMTVDYIDFNTAYTGQTLPAGRIQWDDGNGTLVVGLKGGTSNMEIGLENMALCYNEELTTLTAGTIVYVSGSQGNRPAIKRAIATSDGYSVTTLGVVSESIASGAEGFVTTFGMVNNLNTTGYSGGTPIWLSPTVSGSFTSVKPQAPQHTVLLGYVVRVHASVGSIFVHISNGWEIDELHDVRLNGRVPGDLLVYSGYNGSNVWVNSKTLNGSYTMTGLTVNGNISIPSVTGATIDTDKFLVSDSGIIKFRTGTQVLSDIGGVDGSGTADYVARFTGAKTLGDGMIQDNGSTVGINVTPASDALLYVSVNPSFLGTPEDYVIKAVNAPFGGLSTGLRGISSTVTNSAGSAVSGEFTASSGSDDATAGIFNAVSTFAKTATGIIVSATGGTNNYSLQLQDNTEGINKVLISKTTDGKANWSSSLLGLTSVQTNELAVNGNITVTGGTQSIFSGNSSSDLVRITQTGSGNAFVVEDSNNPDSSSFVIDANGSVGVGTVSITEKLNVNGNLNLISSTTTKMNIESGAGVRTYLASDGAGTSFGSLTNHNVVFYRNNSEFARMTSTGFGIGTTTPIAKLDVSGDTRITGTLTATTISATTYQNLPKVGFSPINVGVCDTAPTAASTQYYYQTIGEVTTTLSKVKLWGFSGSDLVIFGLYRGSLSGTMTLIGQARATCGLGPNELTLTAETGQNLTITAGEDLVVGYYPDGTSWRTVYDVGISDISFGITNTNNITTMPATPTGTATGIRFACTLY